MTPKLHDELRTIGAFFFLAEISDEESALLQVHMAYCAECHRRFRQNQEAFDSNTVSEPRRQ